MYVVHIIETDNLQHLQKTFSHAHADVTQNQVLLLQKHFGKLA